MQTKNNLLEDHSLFFMNINKYNVSIILRFKNTVKNKFLKRITISFNNNNNNHVFIKSANVL